MNEIETRIVITHKGDKAAVGIQRTDCDPALFTAAGSLPEVLNKLGGFVEEASRRWEVNPRFPKTELATPTPASTTSQATGASSGKTSGSQGIPANKQQEAMF